MIGGRSIDSFRFCQEADTNKRGFNLSPGYRIPVCTLNDPRKVSSSSKKHSLGISAESRRNGKEAPLPLFSTEAVVVAWWTVTRMIARVHWHVVVLLLVFFLAATTASVYRFFRCLGGAAVLVERVVRFPTCVECPQSQQLEGSSLP